MNPALRKRIDAALTTVPGQEQIVRRKAAEAERSRNDFNHRFLHARETVIRPVLQEVAAYIERVHNIPCVIENLETEARAQIGIVLYLLLEKRTGDPPYKPRAERDPQLLIVLPGPGEAVELKVASGSLAADPTTVSLQELTAAQIETAVAELVELAAST
jgi:hypothetical protein